MEKNNIENSEKTGNIAYMSFFILLSSLFIFTSCSTYKIRTATDLDIVESVNTANIKKIPVEPSYIIMGEGKRTKEELASFLYENNSELEYGYALSLADVYINEAVNEGVNYDIAFSQMCLETGYQKYTGIVTPKQNNFAGLGAIDVNHTGEKFQSVELGVRAHIQHLKAYASTDELNNEVIDRRFKYVQRGIAPTIFDLTGKWASDPEYGEKIKSLLLRLYNFPISDKN